MTDEKLSEYELENIKYLLTLRYNPYRPPEFPRAQPEDFEEFEGIQSAVEPLIRGLIKSRITKQEPRSIGIAISGGVDSTFITAMTRACFPGKCIKTASIIFGEDDKEAEDAERVAEQFGTYHKTIQIKSPIVDFPLCISMVKEPRWNAYEYYYFNALKDNDLIMTGDGGDEVFGGYTFRLAKVFRPERLTPKVYLDNHMMDWVPDQDLMFGPAINFSWEDIYNTIASNFNNSLSKLGKVFLADFNGKLIYDFIPTNNRYIEALNINVFAPMLDPTALAIETHVPYRLKFDHRSSIGKILLRQILMENFAFQAATKPKMGFGMDRVEMWTKFHHVFDSLLDTSTAEVTHQEIISRGWLKKYMTEIDRMEGQIKVRYITKVLSILAVEVYLRLKTGSMKPTDKLE